MRTVHSNVAIVAATFLQAWQSGSFSAVRANSGWESANPDSLLDAERRDLLEAVIQQMESGGEGCACGNSPLPDVKVEACLNLLRHLGSQTGR